MVRGPVTSVNKGHHEITVLNSTFSTAKNTDFEVDDIDVDTQDDFFDIIQKGEVVTIEDERVEGDLYGDGIADEVEIEE